MGRCRTVLGTRQVLACLRCQFFWREGRNLEDARGEKKRGGFLSSSRVLLALPVLAELSRQASVAEHHGYKHLVIHACEKFWCKISLRNCSETLTTQASVR